jgi:soluble lytic murein transglycosylase-like protein
MKLKIYLWYFKPFLLLAGLIMCAASAADQGDALSSTSQSVEIATQPIITTVNEDAGVLCARTTFKNSSAILVPRTYKFNNTVGTPAYYAEAYAYSCRAAKSGDANGYYFLGWLYSNGRGVAKDESIAAQLYAKAAEQGHPLAQQTLASMPATTSQPEMPACLLPDPPAPVAGVSTPGTVQTEQQGETTSVFYSNGPILKLVDKLAPRYQIDPNLAMAFIAVESGFDTQAVSPKNAQGLMQLIPETAKRFRVRNAFNAEDNIKGGLAYLQWLLAFFKGNVQLVAAAYNAGERTVEKFQGVPPYPETQSYVQKIAALYKKSSHPFRDDLVKASPFLNSP